MAKHDSFALPPLVERPGHLIRRLQQISFAIFIEQTRMFDITPVQYAAIFAINDNPGIDQTALCNLVAYDRSTIGDVVGRLEGKKLISRRNDPLDLRRKFLYITPLGRRIIRDIEPAVGATQGLILAPLKASERRAFLQLLKRLVHLNNKRSRVQRRSKDTRPEGATRLKRAGTFLRKREFATSGARVRGDERKL